jgi:hypothetical protein
MLREHLARVDPKNTARNHDGDGNGYYSSARHRYGRNSYNREFCPILPVPLLLIDDRYLFHPQHISTNRLLSTLSSEIEMSL